MCFLGAFKHSKGYHLYDEVNKKFVASRDVIFLETNKNNQFFDRKIDLLDKISHIKTYYEVDNEIPHLEWGIHILDQYLEFPFEAPTPPHEESREEEVPPTSPKQEDQMDDVIERIGVIPTQGQEN